jgi:predicted kinase
MKKLTVLSGISGAGKTHYRKKHLAHFKFVDMADIYLKYDCQWNEALGRAFDRLEELFEDNDQVVLEGYFLDQSISRQWLEYMSERCDWELEIIPFSASYEVCLERILQQAEDEMATADDLEKEDILRFRDARLKLLDSYLEA